MWCSKSVDVTHTNNTKLTEKIHDKFKQSYIYIKVELLTEML